MCVSSRHVKLIVLGMFCFLQSLVLPVFVRKRKLVNLLIDLYFHLEKLICMVFFPLKKLPSVPTTMKFISTRRVVTSG